MFIEVTDHQGMHWTINVQHIAAYTSYGDVRTSIYLTTTVWSKVGETKSLVVHQKPEQLKALIQRALDGANS